MPGAALDTFEQIAGQLWPRLYRTAIALCRNRDDAQDLVQDTLVQAMRKWNQFEGRSDPATWLYTIAARLCHRRRRRRAGEPLKIEPLVELIPSATGPLADVSAALDPHETATRREVSRVVTQAIAELPTGFRVPLVLVDIAELKTSEAARILGIKETTVKTRVHRARLKLRKVLAEQLPSRAPSPCSHSRQVCLDLLQAKQDALDRKVPFSFSDGELCARCSSVMATLDVAAEACRTIGLDARPTLPASSAKTLRPPEKGHLRRRRAAAAAARG